MEKGKEKFVLFANTPQTAKIHGDIEVKMRRQYT